MTDYPPAHTASCQHFCVKVAVDLANILYYKTETMKAVICSQYGPPDVLQIEEVAKPKPNSNQLLVRVAASAVNSGDVRVRKLDVKGLMKIIMRLVLGISKPRKPILGTVYAGVVETVGDNVTTFKPGDKIFGMSGFDFGAHAEYIVINQNRNVIKMPANASFEEAAAIIFGGQTAIYFLDKLKIDRRPNQKILVIGATGSVGSAAIQIAKYYRTDVTAVCSSQGQYLVNELGITDIVLYDKESFTSRTDKFDIIFDAIGKYSKNECKKLLNKKGMYKSVNGTEYASETKQQLQLLKELFEKNVFKAIIDKTFRMDEIREAHWYVESGRKKGNVVLQISQ